MSILQCLVAEVFLILAGLPDLQCLPFAPGIAKPSTYNLHKFLGEKVRVHCDAFLAGLIVSDERVVWSLALRRLSDSGCNPKDPVTTLVELNHVRSTTEADQIKQCIDKPPGWTFHAEGAVVNQDKTNAHTAWVGVTLEQARLEDSGTYRCDALVGGYDGSVLNTSRSSFTVLTVSAPDRSVPGFTHMTVQESISAIDYDSSVIQPTENHRRVGQAVNVTCSPRLLRNAPRFPFPVSSAAILFLPFHQPDSVFRPVVSLSEGSRSVKLHLPAGRNWKVHHHKDDGKLADVMNSSHLRIQIEIPAVRIEDTGIFLCSVTKATTGNIYHGKASLKVSDNPKLLSGYCDPSPSGEEGRNDPSNIAPHERDYNFDSWNADGLDAAAKTFSEYRDDFKTMEPFENVPCVVVMVVISVEILIIIYLARIHYWQMFCCCCPRYLG